MRSLWVIGLVSYVLGDRLESLKYDCQHGTFKYCPRRRLICMEYPDGMWDIRKLRHHQCDPENDESYGCECHKDARLTQYFNDTNSICDYTTCYDRMTKYYEQRGLVDYPYAG